MALRRSAVTAAGALRGRLRSARRVVAPRRADYAPLLGVVLAGLLLYHRRLGTYTLRRWDEAIYASAAKHVVEDGYWLIPHVRGGLGGVGLHPFLEKPPLAIWLQAASMSVLGVNEFAARLPSATFAVLTAVVVYLLGRDVDTRLTGYLGALVFLLTPHLYGATNLGRFAGTDTTMLFFGTAGVYLVWRAVDRERPALLVPAGVAAGLAALAKGFNAGIFAIVLLPLVASHVRLLAGRAAVGATAAFAAVALPWHLYALARYGDAFVHTYVVEQVVERALTDPPFDRGPTLFAFMDYPYVREFPAWFDPWTYFLFPAAALALWVAARRADRSWRRDVLFLAWWPSAVFWFFVLTGDHNWYVAPMYVPCAVLVGWLFATAARRRVPGRAAPVAVVAGAAATLAFSYHVAPSRTVPFGLAPVRGPAFLLPFAAGLLAVAGYPTLREVGGQWPTAVAAAGRRVLPVVVAVALVLVLVGAPPTNPWRADVEQRALADEIEAATPSDATLYVDAELADKPLFPFAFYLDRRIEAVAWDDLPDRDVEYALLTASPEQLSARYGLDPPLVAVSGRRRLPFFDTSDVVVAFARRAPADATAAVEGAPPVSLAPERARTPRTPVVSRDGPGAEAVALPVGSARRGPGDDARAGVRHTTTVMRRWHDRSRRGGDHTWQRTPSGIPIRS